MTLTKEQFIDEIKSMSVLDLADIVKATIFVVGQEFAQPGRDLCGEYFDRDNPPANTLVVCQALADPDFLVEVQAIAAV